MSFYGRISVALLGYVFLSSYGPTVSSSATGAFTGDRVQWFLARDLPAPDGRRGEAPPSDC